VLKQRKSRFGKEKVTSRKILT